jgi:hypothetical protein
MRNWTAIQSLADGVNSPAIFTSQSGQRASPPTFSGWLTGFTKGYRQFFTAAADLKAQCCESYQNQELTT